MIVIHNSCHKLLHIHQYYTDKTASMNGQNRSSDNRTMKDNESIWCVTSWRSIFPVSIIIIICCNVHLQVRPHSPPTYLCLPFEKFLKHHFKFSELSAFYVIGSHKKMKLEARMLGPYYTRVLILPSGLGLNSWASNAAFFRGLKVTAWGRQV